MRQSARRRLFGAAVVAGVVLAAVVGRSPAAALETVEGFRSRPALFALVLVGLYLLRPVVLWPISAVSILVGYVIGPVGVPVGLAGAVLTCLPPFVAARTLRTGGLFERVGSVGERLVSATGACRGLIAARLAPLPADPVSYAAGLSGVSVGAFVTGTAVGELPWVTAAVLAGSSMRTLTLEGVQPGLPLVVGATSLAVLVLAGPAYRHVRTGGVAG